MPVVVAGRLLDGQIDRLELLVDGDLRPHARVARVLVRAAQPALGAELAAHRHRVEDPQPLARARVEAAHVAFRHARARRVRARRVRGADDDDVLRDDRRRVQADLAVQRVEVLIDRSASDRRCRRRRSSRRDRRCARRARSFDSPASRRRCACRRRSPNTRARGPRAAAARPGRARLRRADASTAARRCRRRARRRRGASPPSSR